MVRRCICLAFIVLGPLAGPAIGAGPSESTPADPQGRIEPCFDGSASFLLRDRTACVKFADGLIRIGLRPADGRPGWGLRWSIDGARPIAPAAEGPRVDRINYFTGAVSRSQVPAYSRVAYDEILPGVRLVAEPRFRGFKYTLHLAAGVDPSAIRFRFEGPLDLRLAEGGLEIATGAGMLTEGGLSCWQPAADGSSCPVAAQYAELHRDSGASWTYGIRLEGVDLSRPLVIDPTISWATYQGDTGYGQGDGAMTIDAAGNVYLCGFTTSADFPVTAGAWDEGMDGFSDAFVTKRSTSGAILWSTFLGGSGDEDCYSNGIALDASDNVVVAGQTTSADFPVTAGVYQSSLAGGWDAFVTKLDASGDSLLWSTYLGGTGTDAVRAVALAPTGVVVLGGNTSSIGFPGVGSGFDSTRGATDGFVSRLSADGTTLAWSTYVGGAGQESLNDLALDASGSILVAGFTDSTDLPLTAGAIDGALTDTVADPQDGFVMKIGSVGSLTWSTYLGGGDRDGLYGVAADAAGNAIAVGFSMSSDFPLSNAFQSTRAGTQDAVVCRILADGSALSWSSFLGTGNAENARSVALDAAGDAILGGITASPDGSVFDCFLSKVLAGGPYLMWTDTFGAPGGYDILESVAANPTGLYAFGSTFASGFPATPGMDTTFSGFIDCFVARFALPAPPAIDLPGGTSLVFTAVQGGAIPAPQLLTLGNSGGERLYWTASETSPWLTTAPASGALDAGNTVDLSVQVNPSGLAVGVHAATIQISGMSATGSPVTVDVTLNVVAAPTGGGSGSGGGSGGGGGCSASAKSLASPALGAILLILIAAAVRRR